MKRNLALRISGCGRHVLAALAVLAILGMATPSASAAVSLFYTANGAPAGGIPLLSGVATGTVNTGTFSYSLTATSTDSASLDRLNTTTINVTNTGAAATLTLSVTGIGYTLGGTTTTGMTVQAQTSVSGTGGPATNGTDHTTATASADGSNAKFGTATSLLSSNGTTPTAPFASTYTFTPPVGAVGSFTVASGAAGFSLTQTLAITLGTGDSASFTVTTNAAPTISSVPEPSSLAIAGLGGLGMIGFGLRRRKALGA